MLTVSKKAAAVLKAAKAPQGFGGYLSIAIGATSLRPASGFQAVTKGLAQR
jgi:hypothetical protein